MNKSDLIKFLQALPDDLDIPVQQLNGCITGAQNRRDGTCDVTFSTTRLTATDVTKTLVQGKTPPETNVGIIFWVNNAILTNTINSMERLNETSSPGNQES